MITTPLKYFSYTFDFIDYLQFFTKATAVDWELNESAVNSLLEILSKISHKTSFNDMNLIAKIGNGKSTNFFFNDTI